MAFLEYDYYYLTSSVCPQKQDSLQPDAMSSSPRDDYFLLNHTLPPYHVTLSLGLHSNRSAGEEDGEKLLKEINDRKATLLLPVIVTIMLLMGLGLVGNPLSIYIYGWRWQASSTKVFLFSLAVIDLVNCLITIPTEVITMMFFYTFPSNGLCKVSKDPSTLVCVRVLVWGCLGFVFWLCAVSGWLAKLLCCLFLVVVVVAVVGWLFVCLFCCLRCCLFFLIMLVCFRLSEFCLFVSFCLSLVLLGMGGGGGGGAVCVSFCLLVCLCLFAFLSVFYVSVCDCLSLDVSVFFLCLHVFAVSLSICLCVLLCCVCLSASV